MASTVRWPLSDLRGGALENATGRIDAEARPPIAIKEAQLVLALMFVDPAFANACDDALP
jgi:hypothetical protein